MKQGDQAGENRSEASRKDATSPSFHGRLLSRSATSLPDYRKGRPWFRLSPRLVRLTSLGWIAGQGAIFAGGLAIGGGVMLLRRGELLKDRPGMMIFAGLVFMVVAIVSQLVAREGSKSGTSAARS